MQYKRSLIIGSLLFVVGSVHATSQSSVLVVNDLIAEYQQRGAQQPDAEKARMLWTQKFRDKKGEKNRSCASCHTDNLRSAGKHVRTGKVVQPLAPSINSERLTDAGKVEKWFKRNCKWTFGRECSLQEKSDFLSYIFSQ
ncbi:DUF1924 domain-containing protein [Kaarinaea lacus]